MNIVSFNNNHPANIICSYIESNDQKINVYIITFFRELETPHNFHSYWNPIERGIAQIELNLDGFPEHFLIRLSALIQSLFKRNPSAGIELDDALVIFTSFIDNFFNDHQSYSRQIILQPLRNITTKAELKKTLSAIFYAIHFQDNELLSTATDSKHPVFMAAFVMQTLAEQCEEETVLDVVRNVPFYLRVAYTVELNTHYREGSFHAMKAFLEVAKDEIAKRVAVKENIALIHLIEGFRNHYYLADEIAENLGVVDENLKVTTLNYVNKRQLNKLGTEAAKLVQVLQKSVDIFQTCSRIPTPTDREQRIVNSFTILQYIHINDEQALDFVKTYGLYGHELSLSVRPEEDVLNTTLPQVLAWFLEDIVIPETSDEDFSMRMRLLERFFSLYKDLYDGEFFKLGLKRMVFGSATYGKDLSKLPLVFSLLDSLSSMPHIVRSFRHLEQVPVLKSSFGVYLHKIQDIVGQYLGLYAPSRLRKIPIVIIDQSGNELFQKNRRYIERMRAQFNATICHISKQEAIVIARKMKVEPLIVTKHDYFGFAGARNAVFLLAPVIGAIARKGVTSGSDIAQLDEAFLRKVFKTKVVGNTYENSIVHMDDDDVEIRKTALLADIAFAAEHRDTYFFRPNHSIGRETITTATPYSLLNTFHKPIGVYKTTNWTDKQILHAMSTSSMSKPRFCLNLPYGNEEFQDHFRVDHNADYYNHDIRTNYFHLPGRRFPLDRIPASPHTNLTTHLQKSIYYPVVLSIMDTLVNGNIRDRDNTTCLDEVILPWNIESVKLQTTCHSLKDIFSYIAMTSKYTQRYFWHRMLDVWEEPQPSPSYLYQTASQDFTTIANRNMEDRMFDVWEAPRSNKLRFDLNYYTFQIALQDFTTIANSSIDVKPDFKSMLESLKNIYNYHKKELNLLYVFGSLVLDKIVEKTRVSFPETTQIDDEREIIKIAVEKDFDFLECLELARVEIEKTSGKSIADFPIVEALYLVARSLGCGEFSRYAKEAIT